MDHNLFLQQLRDLSLEEGKIYIQEHAAELSDYDALGNLIAEEALAQLYTNPYVSLKLADLLIFFAKLAPDAPSHALGLKAKGDALRSIGHNQAAMEYLDAAGEEFLRLGDEVNWARSRIAWILACAWLGRVKEALQEAARARDVFLRLGEHYWVCVVDHNTAMIYTQLGQYQKALELYERMLTVYPTLTDQSESFIKHAIALAEYNQARNLSWLGNFEQAYGLLQKAQASFIALGKTSFILSAEINLADLDYAQGYYGSALRRYYQVYDSAIQNDLDNPVTLASIMLRMTGCLVKLNRAQEACQLAAKAVEVYRQLDASLDTGDALREYAMTLVAADRPKEALTIFEEAWKLFARSGFDHHASTTQLQQAELLLAIGAATEAYDQARSVREYFDAQGLVSRSVVASLVMAGALIDKAQGIEQIDGQHSLLLEEAAFLCKQAYHMAHQHNLQEQVYKSQYLLGRLAAIKGSLGNAARHYQTAILQIERMLNDLVYDLSPSFLHTTWTVYEDMIALCLQQGHVEGAFSYLERARSITLRQYLNRSKTSQRESNGQESTLPESKVISALLLRTQEELRRWQQEYHKYSALLVDINGSVSPTIDREVIENEIKRCEAKLSELFERLQLYELETVAPSLTSRSKNARHKASGEQQVDIAQLRQYLAPDQLLLAYFLRKNSLVIFALTTEDLILYEIPGGAEQLEYLLPLLHARLDSQGWPDIQRPPAIRPLLKKLYDLLIAPVVKMLPSPSGYLTIVPYGPLHRLPFHALYDGSHFLVENFQINYLPASNLLTHLGISRDGQDVHSVYDATKPPLVLGYSGNGHLQHVTDEAQIVATLLGGRCYLEGDATIIRLIEEAPGSPIIHLATHGKSRLDAPNFSFVRLADGHLNALDAFSMDLKECELVTLSGCETGLALSGGGDEQLGLGRAFLAAGASSLVMSLWPVEDQATSELMQIFYQRLLSGDTKIQALRTAQRHLLDRTSSSYAHPYFWAAFRLVGEVGPLQYKKQKMHSLAFEAVP